MPIEAARVTLWPATSVPAASEPRIRSLISTTSPTVTSSSSTANSSPPSRATVSTSRVLASSRRATSTSTTSPAAWPKRSLTGLKPSRSTKSSATRTPTPAGAVQGLGRPVEQDAAVRQVGQGVVSCVVDHLVGQLEAGERLRADHGERVERVLVGTDRGPGAVLGRRDDPERVLAPAHLRADLVRHGGELRTSTSRSRISRRGIDQQGVDHEPGLVQCLDPDRGLEEDGQPARVLPAVHDRAGVDEQRRQRDDEERESSTSGLLRSTTAAR